LRKSVASKVDAMSADCATPGDRGKTRYNATTGQLQVCK